MSTWRLGRIVQLANSRNGVSYGKLTTLVATSGSVSTKFNPSSFDLPRNCYVFGFKINVVACAKGFSYKSLLRGTF